MKKELDRLANMLREHKISVEDYQLLTDALHKKSIFDSLEKNMLINPFRKIGGWRALGWGVGLMLVMSLLGTYANIFYDGIMGYLVPIGIKTKLTPSFFLLLYQNAIACLTVSLMYFFVAKFFKAKRVRLIDFIGMVTLSRYPILISVFFTYLENLVRPELLHFDPAQGFELRFSLFGTTSMVIFMFCYIWQIATYFFALQESSGLTGRRLWMSFLVTMIFGEVIALTGARFFLYLS
ncbi:MAG: hypothetical protein NTW08_00110 [Gammaproteobacteria bacterium]|nr:hypothetical protein [Gammaproteobacteria bacterium]